MTANELARRLPSQHRIVLVERSAPPRVRAVLPLADDGRQTAVADHARRCGRSSVAASRSSRPRRARSTGRPPRRDRRAGDRLRPSRRRARRRARAGGDPGARGGSPHVLHARRSGAAAGRARRLHRRDRGRRRERAALQVPRARRTRAPCSSATTSAGAGLRGKVDLHLFTPEPQAMPVAGPELGAAVDRMLRGRGIAFHPSHKLTRGRCRQAESSAFDGKPAARYDLLVAIPPHRGPRARPRGRADERGGLGSGRSPNARDASRGRVRHRGRDRDPDPRPLEAGRAAHAPEGGRLRPRRRPAWSRERIAAAITGRAPRRSSAATGTACWRQARISPASLSATSSPSPHPRSGCGASGERGTSARCSSSSGGSRPSGRGGERCSSRSSGEAGPTASGSRSEEPR